VAELSLMVAVKVTLAWYAALRLELVTVVVETVLTT
jgi:hypothetical protein